MFRQHLGSASTQQSCLGVLIYVSTCLLFPKQQWAATRAAGAELTELRAGCLGLGLEVYQGDAGLAHRTELTISSLVDVSSPGR